ncbi:hypothetical protein [Allosalinactinospora lopnorensis]|nr:hypothetical protein [Allosalinactinospora lopnorensis]
MSKPKVSKAEPLSKDLKAILWVNLIAAVSLLLFAAMGLGIATVGAAA